MNKKITFLSALLLFGNSIQGQEACSTGSVPERLSCLTKVVSTLQTQLDLKDQEIDNLKTDVSGLNFTVRDLNLNGLKVMVLTTKTDNTGAFRVEHGLNLNEIKGILPSIKHRVTGNFTLVTSTEELLHHYSWTEKQVLGRIQGSGNEFADQPVKILVFH